MRTLEQLLADDLDVALTTYSALVMARIRADIPELAVDPEVEVAATLGTESILREFARVLRLGLEDGFVTPPQSLAYGRRAARAGVSLAALLRSYRVGQAAMFTRAAELADAHRVPDAADAIVRLGVLSFAFADAAMSDVTAEFEREREALLRATYVRRDATIRALLTGARVDLDAAELTLGHRLRGVTHRAVLAWRPPGAGEDATAGGPDALREALAAALADAAAPRPLLLSEGELAVAWLHAGGEGDPGTAAEPRWASVVTALEPLAAQVAVGAPAAGPEGFARTRRQAGLARAVARRDQARRLTHYGDVALAALLTRDPDAASAFAADELGGLAARTPAMATLRATLTAYLAAGHDRTRTAHVLGVHRNTVARRLQRVHELLGHDVATRGRELDAALAVVDVLGAA
ncbi:helix-turn-helix domain-containing protein [Paraconexibacter antarcticus]|uniref:Helix-turn-helix domain-containing protein n=1 Tax=Paraconexibacter antarcticus TaxID=2949664 RepID=A0ABY5DRH7_9ACTN|nr:PucR family transcriptional regulator [Paraconexibacter antarcticus]UTI63682.1 helix-turn-helix domain-containing protein [Paraconexibacter antarcticus]